VEKGNCLICGTFTNLVSHHIRYAPEEIVLICLSCHKKKHPKGSASPMSLLRSDNNHKHQYNKDFYQKNREKILARQKEYNKKNHEKRLAYSREYEKTHKQESTEYHRRRYQIIKEVS
jgi:hypothetical protein